jgi:hypothetical protein
LYALEGNATVSSQTRSDDSHVDFEEAFARLEHWVDEHASPAPSARRRLRLEAVVPRLPIPAPPAAAAPPGPARGALQGGVVAGATTAVLAAVALVLPMTFLPRPLRPSLTPPPATAATVAPSAPSVPSVPNVLDGSSLSRDAYGGPNGRPVGATDTGAAVP